MAYTVKNGTWCKDNNKEYYSTTKAGLKAALVAGEITAGTKVVIHEPKYHAGQLIQSLNPNCPEGCFVPQGQAFDTNIYEELAKVFPSGVLPDMRECVMVCAGENEHITTHEHDVYSAGEFKDDCAAVGSHSHTITIHDPGHGHTVTDPGHGHTVTDPGHGHTVTDPGHGHTVTDPGHGHTVTDPGHDHGRGSQDITGYLINDSNATTIGGAFTSGEDAGGQSVSGTGGGKVVYFNAANTWSGRSEKVTTGVSVDNNTTGVSVKDNTTGVSVDNNITGVSVNDNTTGVSVKDNTTGVSVKDNTTGITAECSTAGTSGANVTRTKQFGVYYYIAF